MPRINLARELLRHSEAQRSLQSSAVHPYAVDLASVAACCHAFDCGCEMYSAAQREELRKNLY